LRGGLRLPARPSSSASVRHFPTELANELTNDRVHLTRLGPAAPTGAAENGCREKYLLEKEIEIRIQLASPGPVFKNVH